jgi:hypothetical protein
MRATRIRRLSKCEAAFCASPAGDLGILAVATCDHRWRGPGHETARGEEARRKTPSAAVIESQSVKTTESGGPRGYDAGKKGRGRKRQVMVDTDGRGLILEPSLPTIAGRSAAGSDLLPSFACP